LDDGVDDEPAAPAPSLRTDVLTPAGPVSVHVWPGRDGASRRPVLFALHGWTDSGEVFGPLAAALGRRWTVVAPDAPGHGRTPWRPAPVYSVPGHAAGALAVLDRLPTVAGHRSRVVVLGHSMGALAASRLAAARPELVRQLVLEDPARTTRRYSRSSARTRAGVRALRDLPAGETAVAAPADWPADEAEPWLRSKREVDLAHLEVPADWGEPLMALLADVAQPVTLVRGEPRRGGIVSMTGARRCAAACRGGCEVVALEAGHCPRREAREPFVAVLAAVLGRYER
jgi:pimeloyl-ACP methyl ester carboxylesterase